MKSFSGRLWLTLQVGLMASANSRRLNPLRHAGGNSPWFPGPDVYSISTDVPDECEVDQAAYVVRHGSRYPDLGAYQEWTDLHEKFQSARFSGRGDLSFLPDWEPVLKYPEQQISQVSPTGYKELYNLGVELRFRYPTFYADNTPFLLWANDYQRTIDSARLFARGYLGPNATFGDVYVVNSEGAQAVGNSLATSDQCPNFHDNSGGDKTATWDSIYLPPITERLNNLLRGNLTLTDSDVSLFPYLCGFESQITGKVSPWCSVLHDDELLQYEYRQDLRYYYGTGPGSGENMTVMLPVLQGVIELLQSGPNTTYNSSDGMSPLPPLIIAFTHDNQINELASVSGIFDDQSSLPANRLASSRTYVSSNITPMRGTVALERLNCTAGEHQENTDTYVRLRLNDAVYPVSSCQSGPGRSCPLSQYAKLVHDEFDKYGSFASVCGLQEGNVTSSASGGVTFFTDLTLPFLRVVKP